MTTYLDRSPNVAERWNERRYKARLKAARLIAAHFGVPISSALRTSVPPGGSPTSLHLKSRGGLAVDFGGPDPSREARVCRWAAKHPGLFQEVMHHDVGGGLHAHIAFAANLRFVVRKVRRALKAA